VQTPDMSEVTIETSSKVLRSYLNFVDKLIEWTTRFASLFYLPIIIFIILEVVLRYIFNSPTSWVWPVSIQFYGSSIALVGSYLMLKNGHIRVDVIYDRLSPRKKLIFEFITSIFLILFLFMFIWWTAIWAFESVRMLELDKDNPFVFPKWPMKVVLLIGGIWFFFAWSAKFIRDIIAFSRLPKRRN
jgi:TRAP-type mannitol/chloroaromatic compound transport system permease small subunit